MAFALRSPAFESGGAIPDRYLRDGQNLSPPLRWIDPPAGTRSFLLAVEDPNTPHAVARLWTVYGISRDQAEMPEGVNEDTEGIVQAVNDLGHRRYDGPQPPRESGVYHYHFMLAALDVSDLEVPDDATAGDVWRAASFHITERADLVGLIERR